MIKKLFSLIWTLFTDTNISYNWSNLWWYLTKGYTLSDVQDGDTYILNLVREFILDLNQYKKDLNIIGMWDFEQDKLYNLINIKLSREFDYLKTEYQEEVIKELEENLKDILNLWI